jgi:hypothetical protein
MDKMDPSYKDRMRKLADKKARKKGKMDPEAQPGFKPRPFLEKIKDKNKGGKKKAGITTLPIKPGMRTAQKSMPMRKMKDK